jgi:hypothetical protein
MTILGDPTLIIHCPKNFPPSGSEISGPEVGATGREYCFAIEVFDEEEDAIFCRWSWGDGAVSEWLGPYSSGDIINVSYHWDEVGEYRIEVQLKDERGSETGWLYPKTINIMQAPIVMIKNIEGGILRLSTIVKNDGAFAAENVNWRISLDGGLILIGRESTGVIDAIGPGAEINIGSGPILGVGKTRVFVEVSCKDSMDLRDQKAIMLFFYLYVTPGGG